MIPSAVWSNMSRLIFYLFPRVFHLLTFGGGEMKKYVTAMSRDIHMTSVSQPLAQALNIIYRLYFSPFVNGRKLWIIFLKRLLMNDMQLRKHSEGLKQERGNKAQYVLGGFRYRTFDLCLFCRFWILKIMQIKFLDESFEACETVTSAQVSELSGYFFPDWDFVIV